MSNQELIAEAKRELKMRQQVYPNWVESGKITQSVATHRINAMAAIVAILEATEPVQGGLFD